MPTVNRDELRNLLRPGDGPCASIYLPVHPIGDGILEDLVRLKNLLRTADQQLQGAGITERETAAMLAPARRLLDKDQELAWRRPGAGMCVLASRADTQIRRLPMPVPELVHVGNRFLLRPLLPLFATDSQFHVLVLSQGSVRLLLADREGANELQLELPRFEEVVGRDYEQKALQAHGSGAHGVAFHGHGEGRDDRKVELDKFLHAVDDALRELRPGRLPLVLAGVDHVQAMFRKITKHQQVVADGITGNAERMPVRELHERAWALVAPRFRTAKEQALARFHASLGTGLATADPREAVLAASHGKVGTLLLDRNAELWGRVGTDLASIEEHPARRNGDEDLLDFVAVETLRHGGAVHLMRSEELPGQSKLAALLRQ